MSKDLEKENILLKGSIEMFQILVLQQQTALEEIIAIAEPHAEWTQAYRKICNVARRGLGEKE